MTLPEQFKSVFEPDLLEELEKRGTFVFVNAGSTILDIGQTVRTMPVILSGLVKVSRLDEQGNELQGNTGSIYSVEMKVTSPTILPSSGAASPESLATVTIKIANDPGGHRGSVFGDPAKYTAYSALVARTAGKLNSSSN